MRRTARAAVLLIASATLLAGCAHVDALQPVKPDQRTKVRFAAIDVLEQNGVRLRDAPQCQRDDRRDVTCDGTTIDGTAVTARTPRDDPDTLTVAVGGQQLYRGSLSSVLEKAAEDG